MINKKKSIEKRIDILPFQFPVNVLVKNVHGEQWKDDLKNHHYSYQINYLEKSYLQHWNDNFHVGKVFYKPKHF